MQLQGVPLNDIQALNRIRDGLKAVYELIPDTKGCMDNIHAEGGCGAWCCETQNPQVLYTEFVNAWRHVNQDWDSESLVQLIGSAVSNFLNNSITKGCVFWDKRTKLCTLHEQRPMNCRIYGITPDEEFKPRYEKLKVLYPNENVRPQCSLISTIDGTPITKADTDRYWEKLVEVEKSYGVPAKQITDAPGGTYRTFHDHIMMSLYTKNVLVQLTKMRIHATQEEKDRFVLTVMSFLRKKRAEDAKAKAVAEVIQEEHRLHWEAQPHSLEEAAARGDIKIVTKEAEEAPKESTQGSDGVDQQGSGGPEQKQPD